MPIAFHNTRRGFLLGTFDDAYAKKCSIQQSSASEPRLWLGCDELLIVDGEMHNSRMHLTRAMVAELIPLLQHFVETGELVEPNGGT